MLASRTAEPCETGEVTHTRERAYGGVPADQRRADRRRRLIAAGLDLIGTEGLSGTTFRAVCERARVGPRFFYESFPDVESLAIALFDEVIHDAMTQTEAANAVAAHDLTSQVRTAIETFLPLVIDDRRVARLIFVESYATPHLLERRFAAMRELTELSVQQTSEYIDLPAEDGQRILNAVTRLITGGIAELVLSWLQGGQDIDHDQLIDVCAEFMIGTIAGIPAIAAHTA